MRRPARFLVLAVAVLALAPAIALAGQAGTTTLPWWGWPLILFAVTFVLGIFAVLGGVGGGVLFVPIVSGFFPFHLDFVRGAGLMVALAGALSAGPDLLRNGMASLRLALPLALIASASAIVGALAGLAMPTHVVQTALGVTILVILVIMASARKSEFPEVPAADALSTALRINGIYYDAASSREIDWKVHRTPQGLALFAVIGVMAGMFGLGAGWANVPALNLLMGAPLKVSVATSSFILSIVDSSAAWVYFNQGAVLAIVTVPSIIGMMLGARVGVRLLKVAPASAVRKVVLAMLAIAGTRAVLKGLGIWN
jgi:uncharacterized protein